MFQCHLCSPYYWWVLWTTLAGGQWGGGRFIPFGISEQEGRFLRGKRCPFPFIVNALIHNKITNSKLLCSGRKNKWNNSQFVFYQMRWYNTLILRMLLFIFWDKDHHDSLIIWSDCLITDQTWNIWIFIVHSDQLKAWAKILFKTN